MQHTTSFVTDEEMPRSRLAVLLEHFSRLDDGREQWRVMYPLSENRREPRSVCRNPERSRRPEFCPSYRSFS